MPRQYDYYIVLYDRFVHLSEEGEEGFGSSTVLYGVVGGELPLALRAALAPENFEEPGRVIDYGHGKLHLLYVYAPDAGVEEGTGLPYPIPPHPSKLVFVERVVMVDEECNRLVVGIDTIYGYGFTIYAALAIGSCEDVATDYTYVIGPGGDMALVAHLLVWLDEKYPLLLPLKLPARAGNPSLYL